MIKSKRENITYFAVLHIVLVVYSFAGVLSKFASNEEKLSLRFIFLYGGVVAILGLYAIVWQQVLKHIPLTTAFCNKAICIIWGMLWGLVIFKETIKINMIIGAVIVIIGVIIVVKSDVPDSKNNVIEEVSADEQ